MGIVCAFTSGWGDARVLRRGWAMRVYYGEGCWNTCITAGGATGVGVRVYGLRFRV